jgi:hypothetical protein
VLITFNSDRSAPKDQPKTVKTIATYTPLASAIQHRWSSLTKRQTKEINPALFFAVLGELILIGSILFTPQQFVKQSGNSNPYMVTYLMTSAKPTNSKALPIH